MKTAYEQIEQMYVYYKNRYEKGERFGITASSKHYALFQEIEVRYLGLGLCMEFAQKFPKNKTKQNFFGYFQTISNILISLETIKDEDGTDIYIQKHVPISQQDTVSQMLYKNGQNALNRLITMLSQNFSCHVDEIIENFFQIVQWQLRVRELQMPIIR